ncbi:MAG: hypothetical protein K2G45_04180 [Lachnospiraceae bacterium]|nr:hypothetical protein [Lachnospiraceae bacterium]
MIDENRVKLMTKLAIYEKKEGHRAVPMSKYYKKDYVRYNVLKTWVAATVVYWSVFAAYIYMSFEDVLTKINELDYFDIMYKLLLGYAAFCVIYYLFSSMVYGYRYEKARKGLSVYNGNLKKLIAVESGEDISNKVVVSENDDFEETVEPEVNPVAKQKIRVSRTELMRNQQELEEKKKEQQIIENVRKRNERIASQNENLLRQQRQVEEDKRRIRERRQQLEREHMDRLRMQRMQQMQQQQNYSYSQKSQNDEGRDR